MFKLGFDGNRPTGYVTDYENNGVLLSDYGSEAEMIVNFAAKGRLDDAFRRFEPWVVSCDLRVVLDRAQIGDSGSVILTIIPGDKECVETLVASAKDVRTLFTFGFGIKAGGDLISHEDFWKESVVSTDPYNKQVVIPVDDHLLKYLDTLYRLNPEKNQVKSNGDNEGNSPGDHAELEAFKCITRFLDLTMSDNVCAQGAYLEVVTSSCYDGEQTDAREFLYELKTAYMKKAHGRGVDTQMMEQDWELHVMKSSNSNLLDYDKMYLDDENTQNEKLEELANYGFFGKRTGSTAPLKYTINHISSSSSNEFMDAEPKGTGSRKRKRNDYDQAVAHEQDAKRRRTESGGITGYRGYPYGI